MKKSILLVLTAVVICLTVVGCGKAKDPIVGKWAYGSGDSFVFTFNEDKTCHYSANNKNCTYTVDGEKLSILYEGDTAPFETTFRIEDNKFIMKDSFDNDVTYTRK